MLLLVALVDQLHDVFKHEPAAPTDTEQPWFEQLRQSLCHNGPELAEACAGLLEMYEEELLKAEGAWPHLFICRFHCLCILRWLFR